MVLRHGVCILCFMLSLNTSYAQKTDLFYDLSKKEKTYTFETNDREFSICIQKGTQKNLENGVIHITVESREYGDCEFIDSIQLKTQKIIISETFNHIVFKNNTPLPEIHALISISGIPETSFEFKSDYNGSLILSERQTESVTPS